MNALFKKTASVHVVPENILTHGTVQARKQSDQTEQNVLLNVAEEFPVALVYNGISHVVLMATPQHLVELAYGFSLSEGIIERASQIYEVDIESHVDGITVHIELANACFAQLKQRRRQMNGRTGCGVCGIESLNQIKQVLPIAQHCISMTAEQLAQGFMRLTDQQPINQLTGGCHAAALWHPVDDVLHVFEDVGRHNALDKLIGWRLLNNNPLGALLLTSRLSYELVQKAAYAQLPMIAAISAPTGMAVQLAQQAGIHLAVFVRDRRLTWIDN